MSTAMHAGVVPPSSAPIVQGGGGSSYKAGGFFASWRRSYRLRSKSSAAQTGPPRKKDAKSMENLLNNERPVPR